MSKQLESKSKFLSLVLRHKPEEIGLALDDQGWANLDDLISLANAKGAGLSREIVLEVVATSDKKRFALTSDNQKIRANQGHSVAVDLSLASTAPPLALYHGTATRFVTSIRQQGLLPGSRQHVHLSAASTTAFEVGSRHGVPVVLTVRAAEMSCDSHEFYISENGVWLTHDVPVRYLDFPAGV